MRASHFTLRIFLLKFKISAVMLIFQCMVATTMNTYASTSCTVCYRVFYNLFWKISLQFLFHQFSFCLNVYCFPHVQYFNIQTYWEGAYLTGIGDSLVYSVLDLCGMQQNALLHSNLSTAVTAETCHDY